MPETAHEIVQQNNTSDVGKSEVMKFAYTWMGIERIVLNEITQGRGIDIE